MNRFGFRWCKVGLATVVVTLAVVPLAFAQNEKPLPKVAMCVPLAAMPGATTKIVVRGWGLDQATEVRVAGDKVAVKLVGKGVAAIPNKQDAKQIGDTQVEIEATVAADAVAGEVSLVIIGPNGEIKPHTLLISGPQPVVLEKEANDGFRQAQPLAVPQIVDGQLHEDRNVDVYSLEITQPQKLAIEVVARRRGSGLDSILTLFDARGRIVATNDDHAESADSRIEAALPPGNYFVSLQDAHDRGGAASPYRLTIEPVGS